MDKLLMSIIIPMYNAAGTIELALDSIYNQGLDCNIFEVICVDDCSPMSSSVETVEKYVVEHSISNLRIIKHAVNKRQGAARNTAIKDAKGKWAVYLDSDDYFERESLSQLQRILQENPELDLLMVDCATQDIVAKRILERGHYSKVNQSKSMTGREYMQTQEVPWTPWCTIYNIDFLRRNDIWFEENVRFEDVDYVFNALVKCEKVMFVPLVLVIHTKSSTQTTAVGNNRDAIVDLFKLTYRLRLIAESVAGEDEATSKAILSHHWFKYEDELKRFFWRRPYSDMRLILNNYSPHTPPCKYLLTNMAKYVPELLSVLAYTAKPLLSGMYWLKQVSRRR